MISISEKSGDTRANSSGLRLALGMLRVLAENDGQASFSQLKKELNNTPSATVSRILKVVAEEGWIVRSAQGGYCIGDRYRRAARQITALDDPGKVLQPVVEALARESKESATFVTWEGDGFLFRNKHEMPDSFHYRAVGEVNREDMFRTALGITCMAWQPPEVVAKFAKKMLDNPDLDEWQRRLETVRDEKMCRTLDKGLRFAAPVCKNGLFIGVIAISLLPRELTGEEETRYRAHVHRAAERAGELLAKHAMHQEAKGNA